MYKSINPKTGHAKATIVVVDDEMSILKELKILLNRAYNIHTFVSPEDAEKFVDQNSVDMVISDEVMPEMRGSALLAKIHRKHPDICKLVLSGQAEKDDIVHAINEGHIFSFLYKPVDREQLMNVIEKGLENRMMKMVMKRQNIELRNYSENLRQMVEERTAQLVKAHERLRLLDENKMAFLVYLSHEMDSSLDRIQRLAESLLNYFGLAGSELKIEKRPLSLQQVVSEILLRKGERIARSGIRIDNRIKNDPIIQADPDYFEQVVETVIDNAITYSPEGGEVSIDATASGNKTRLVVSDKGRGILEDDLKNIFVAFAIEPERRHPDGFALNLPIARIIVRAHGGRIWAESEGEGKGATFFVEV